MPAANPSEIRAAFDLLNAIILKDAQFADVYVRLEKEVERLDAADPVARAAARAAKRSAAQGK